MKIIYRIKILPLILIFIYLFDNIDMKFNPANSATFQ